MRKISILFLTIFNFIFISAQINTDRVTLIGRNALYFEDYVLAIQYFNQAIKAKPYIADPYYYRAIAKYYLEDFKGAEDDCTLCIERNSFFTNAYQLRADTRQNQKNYQGALSDYQTSLKENPNDKFILINIGIVNIENKDYDNAENYLNQLVKIYPNYAQGILTRSNLFLEKKDTVRALEDINTAIEKDKYFSPSYSMRGSLLMMQKEYEKALNDFDEAIKLDPLTSANYINRGLTKYYKNDLRGAMSDYDYVINIEPNSLIAHFNRALLRAQVGDDNRAIEDFNFVLKNEPDNYIAYMNRALLKNNIGKTKEALNDLNKVLQEYPDFYQGYQIRSDIKRKQNDLKGAEQDYYLARNIEEKTKKEILSGKTPKNSEDKTREKSDKSIDKFNLLIGADKEEVEKNKYNSETRGKVQNKQANIELLASFIISYYEKEIEFQKFSQTNKYIDQVNKENVLSRKLVITNEEVPLDSTQVAIHFASIDEYSKLLTKQPENAILYFARGLDFMLVQDFTSAIEDLNKAVALDPKFTIAYFNLAVAYTKQLKSKQNIPELYIPQTTDELKVNMPLNGGNSTSNSTSSTGFDNTQKAVSSKLEYETIINNYNQVIALASDLAYAYYNRAEIKAMENDFRGAILDYNEAIRNNSEFAEAYYNRGLSRLRIKDNDRGLDDLRKAGELGITGAYSIIKRMTE